MIDTFDKIIGDLLRSEGGYVNDPDDAGGETNYGISKRAYPNLDIASLSEADAVAIYRRDYWDKVRGDDLPTGIDYLVFDAAVNHGRSKATKLLQKAVGAAVDGVIGKNTITATANANQSDLRSEYTARRTKYYAAIIANKPSQEKYALGWMRRAAKVHRAGDLLT